MKIKSLRDFLSLLEKDGELARVKKAVDRGWEISAVMRRVLSFPSERRPALFFENVQGFSIPVVVGLFVNRRRYAKALNVREDEIASCWDKALRHPISPVMVGEGPCKEVRVSGEKVDLSAFPIPTWTPERDAAPYITAPCVITRDPDSGYINVGNYRLMYKDKDRTGLFVNPVQDIGMMFEKYRRANKAMEVAVAIGVHPALNIVATAKVPHGLSELDVAGGLVGAPLEMVKAESVDLPVPAQAEIVLEGEVDPHYTEVEGPFGEFAGFMSPSYQMPVFRLKAITHRRDPIYHCLVSQKPPSESSMLRAVSNGALLLRDLNSLGMTWVTGLHIPEAGCAWYHIVVAIKKGHPAHPRVVMNAIWAAKPQLAKMVVVVDDDIDILDPFQVEWAVATRVQPARDVLIISDHVGQMEDPSQAEGQRHLASKMGIDATRKYPYPEASLPGEKYMALVEKNWGEYGITELDL